MMPNETDLAWVHDVGFGWYARQSALGILNLFKQRGIESGRVVDLGCGRGIWARSLVDAGCDVAGSDISSAMIEIARERVPKATFQVASFLDVDLPQCAAVTALGEVFNYLFDTSNGKRALRSLFRRVFYALGPQGLFIFDVAEPTRQTSIQKGFSEGDGWLSLYEVEHNETNARLTRRCVTFRRVSELWRRHEEIHELQLWLAEDIAELLQDEGFHVQLTRRFGEYELPQGLVGLVASKSSKAQDANQR